MEGRLYAHFLLGAVLRMSMLLKEEQVKREGKITRGKDEIITKQTDGKEGLS